jgi:hypothetical protein
VSGLFRFYCGVLFSTLRGLTQAHILGHVTYIASRHASTHTAQPLPHYNPPYAKIMPKGIHCKRLLQFGVIAGIKRHCLAIWIRQVGFNGERTRLENTL